MPDATANSDAGQDGSEPVGLDASDNDAASDASGLPDTGAPDAFVDAGPSGCDFSGTWATRIQVALTWGGNVGLNAGSGTGYMWIRHEATANGGIVPGTMVGCGLSTPGLPFTALSGGGTGRLDFALPLFGSAPPKVSPEPVLQVQGTGLAGDAVSLSPTALLLGTSMADPVNGTWPPVAQTVVTDSDSDGKPGVTVPHLNGGGYVYLPIEPFASSRSDVGYYAWRVAVSLSGSVVSCSEAAGPGNVTAFDHHLLACRRVGGADCNSTQVNLLESSRPLYVPGASTYRMIKVANGASCAAVKSALP
ncbi:MAG TPA: hypothetical protein VI299_16465 [Polyangiales bacterium]